MDVWLVYIFITKYLSCVLFIVDCMSLIESIATIRFVITKYSIYDKINKFNRNRKISFFYLLELDD
jgi:hypothetical protein